MHITANEVKKFQRTVSDYYKKNKRAFPWRPPQLLLRKDGRADPYKILVSEIMLQQTQADRVVPFFNAFMKKFPTVKALAKGPQAEVLKSWQGLGYNRRALNLKRAAERIVSEFGGVVPATLDELDSLPGVGRYTAGAVLAFSHNLPSAFIETNIRSVYLHFFFKNRENVRDAEILELVEQTLPNKVQSRSYLFPDSRSDLTKVEPCSVREWYAALMDYGAMLKETIGNPNPRSAHYGKQKAFKGSRRELRGEILRKAGKGLISARDFTSSAAAHFSVSMVLNELTHEGFLRKQGQKFGLA
ncbi:MAG: A/G-specific adenine glycosylase [bacterium]|nr:A/G-specific adenine glycosylase [bacterium]